MRQNILPVLSTGTAHFTAWSIIQLFWFIRIHPSRFCNYITSSCQFLPGFKNCYLCDYNYRILYTIAFIILMFQMNNSLKWQQICLLLRLIFWPKRTFSHINSGECKSDKNGSAGLFEAGRAGNAWRFKSSEMWHRKNCPRVGLLDSWWRHSAPLKYQWLFTGWHSVTSPED
jgi:hypothetical protein